MPSERTVGYLQDIKQNIELAESFVAGATAEEFEQSILQVYATTRSLEIISEASRRLPDELKARYPEVNWRQVADAGNLYRHGYNAVAPRRIWETVKSGLPPLSKLILQELG